jgi:transglutaminase-like putative cysteine protease
MITQLWLQLHLVALCILGSLFVALTTTRMQVPAGVLIAGVLSIMFTDRWKWVQVNRLLGNVAAVGAVVFSLRNFWGSDSEGQLLAIATLLVYLEIILFFQEKNPRLYWQIILLSLLQVVVGAALHLGFAFGVLLLAYTIVALSTLVLFFIHRETEQHGEQFKTVLPTTPTSRWKRLLGQPIVVRIEGNREQLQRAFFSPALARQIASLTAGALLFAAAFFYAAPRHPTPTWNGPRGFSRPETGFSRNVELQQMGEMLQSDEKVLQLSLTDSLDQPLGRVDPYLTGEVLAQYEVDQRGRARWLAIGLGSPLFRQNDYVQEREAIDPPPAPAEVSLMHLTMLRASESLFVITPGYRVANTSTDFIRMDESSGLLFQEIRPDGNNQTTFSVATTGIVHGKQASISPEIRPRLRRHRWASELAAYTQFNAEEEHRFAGIKAVAQQQLAARGVSSSDPVLIARTLEEYFHTPRLFTYSLNLNVKRDPALDPIEDFVVNHRTGHCQYFASALVMMLRSQGLPARLVVGYRASEYNELGKFYQVRQRNAHAWVEMYLEKDQVPSYETVGGEVGDTGAWLRLDPTPASDTANPLAQNWFGTARDWLDYVDMIWGDYVVSLSQKRQEEVFYGAFQSTDDHDSAGQTWRSWQEQLRQAAAWFGIHIGQQGDMAFDWRAALTAMVLTAVLVLLARLFRWLWPRIDWSSWFSWRPDQGRRSPVAFYNRLEDLLARRGRSRRPAETPQEYIDHAVRDLSLLHGDSLRLLVMAFYRVRYGEIQLDNDEVAAIERALADLERLPLRETG